MVLASTRSAPSAAAAMRRPADAGPSPIVTAGDAGTAATGGDFTMSGPGSSDAHSSSSGMAGSGLAAGGRQRGQRAVRARSAEGSGNEWWP